MLTCRGKAGVASFVVEDGDVPVQVERRRKVRGKQLCDVVQPGSRGGDWVESSIDLLDRSNIRVI